MWRIDTIEYYSAIRKKEIMTFSEKQIKLRAKHVEIIQAQKAT
jgi:hypothetical protein